MIKPIIEYKLASWLALHARQNIPLLLLIFLFNTRGQNYLLAQNSEDTLQVHLFGSTTTGLKWIPFTDGSIQRINYQTKVDLDLKAVNRRQRGDLYFYDVPDFSGGIEFGGIAVDSISPGMINVLEIGQSTSLDVQGGEGELLYSISKKRVVSATLELPPIVTYPADPYRIQFRGFEPADRDTILLFVALPSGWYFHDAYGMYGRAISPLIIQLVDPIDNMLKPILVDKNGDITNDLHRLATASEALIRDGAAADGITRLIVRVSADPGTNIELSIPESGQDNGCLTSIDDANIKDEVEFKSKCTKKLTVTSTNEGYAFAVYHAPNTFINSYSANLFRSFSIKASYENFSKTYGFNLFRAPVLAVHGLNSSGAMWDPLLEWNDKSLGGKYYIFPTCYKERKSAHFSVNNNVVPSGIRIAIINYKRENNIAAVAVDVVSHSMGGILTRWYLSDLSDVKYQKSINYMKGDIRKFITLDTPHSGSQLGNFAYALRNAIVPVPVTPPYFYANAKFSDVAKSLGFELENAVFDLAIPVGEYALNGTAVLNSRIEDQHPVSAYAIWAEIDLDLPVQFNLLGQLIPELRPYIAFLQAMTWLADFGFKKLYGGPHDLVVPKESQIGGISTNTSYPSYHHLNIAAINPVFIQLDELLEAPPGNANFKSKFLPPGPDYFSVPNYSEQLAYNQNQVNLKTTVGVVQIISPLEGTTLLSGETVIVKAQSITEEPLSEVFFMTPDTMLIDEVQPYEFLPKIPESCLGRYSIIALAKDAMSNLSFHSVNLVISTSANLDSIVIIPPIVLLAIDNETFSLSARGLFDDGIKRDITDPSTGTIYASSDSTVVKVSEEGTLTAVNNGTAKVFISNSGKVQQVEVTTDIRYFISRIENTKERTIVPQKFLLLQNYPNPFNSQINISFELEKKTNVSIRIFNLNGQTVAEVFKGVKEAGYHVVNWDASDISAGMYIVRMEAGGFVGPLKCTLIK